MAGDTVITLVGNLTADPELRFTPSGAAVANFTVASTPRTFDRQSGEWKDGDAMFLNCAVWRQAAENVDVWGKRRLAYEIQKKTEGIYAIIGLTSEPDAVKEMDRLFSINEAIMRTKVMRPVPEKQKKS
jgi:ribosomal protein S6